MSNIKHYDDWQLKSMIATRPTDTFSYIRALEKELAAAQRGIEGYKKHLFDKEGSNFHNGHCDG